MKCENCEPKKLGEMSTNYWGDISLEKCPNCGGIFVLVPKEKIPLAKLKEINSLLHDRILIHLGV